MFEWDENKNKANAKNHGISFENAVEIFEDPRRLTLTDDNYSGDENRYYCIGKVNEEVLTVRFLPRNEKIRIIGAGYWRKGRKLYEEANKLY